MTTFILFHELLSGADGKRYERLCQERIIVNGKHCAIQVVRPRDRIAPSHLVIFAVKHHHLDDTKLLLSPAGVSITALR
jgi:hypothetical protein